jgi:hypothetical protein
LAILASFSRSAPSAETASNSVFIEAGLLESRHTPRKAHKYRTIWRTPHLAFAEKGLE